MIISDSQLQQIMPKMSPAKRELYLPFLNRVMEMFEITSPLRTAAFLAQLAHESGEFRYMEEIWGPTNAQKRYEPPSSLAQRLGNTQPGDGLRFKGRGPIQITGRSNYQRYGDLLGVDLVSNPELASTPQIAFSIAGLYWKNNGLNQLADAADFTAITKRINGGLNGLADRQMYYERARQVLGAARARGLTRAAAPRATSALTRSSAPKSILPRGQEAIEDDLSANPIPASAPRGRAKPAPASTAQRATKTTKKAGKKTAPPSPSAAKKRSSKKTGAVKAKKRSSS